MRVKKRIRTNAIISHVFPRRPTPEDQRRKRAGFVPTRLVRGQHGLMVLARFGVNWRWLTGIHAGGMCGWMDLAGYQPAYLPSGTLSPTDKHNVQGAFAIPETLALLPVEIRAIVKVAWGLTR